MDGSIAASSIEGDGMAYDPDLANRLEEVVSGRLSDISGLTETRIFGGFGFMLSGNMCFGIHKDTLIVRVGAETASDILHEPHVRPMDLTGKVMKGWATLEPGAIANDKSLERYCRLAIDFVSTLPAKPKSG